MKRQWSLATGIKVFTLVAFAWCLGLAGCDDRAPDPTSWPPRTHRLDREAAAVSATEEVTWEIDASSPLKWSGKQENHGGRFMPVQGEFKVDGGVLVSRLGTIEKRATFSDWEYLRESATGESPVGWGPCLTEGEVLLPNVFLVEAPVKSHVANRFDAEDFGDRHTLIRLRPDRKDRLCVWFREPLQGRAFFGKLGQTGPATVSGTIGDCSMEAKYAVFRLDDSPAGVMRTGEEDEDPMLTMTAGFIGTGVTMGHWTFARKSDGWYLGQKRWGQ